MVISRGQGDREEREEKKNGEKRRNKAGQDLRLWEGARKEKTKKLCTLEVSQTSEETSQDRGRTLEYWKRTQQSV